MQTMDAYCDVVEPTEAVRRLVVTAPWSLQGSSLGELGELVGGLLLPLDCDSVLWQWKSSLRCAGFSSAEVVVGLEREVDLPRLRSALLEGRFAGVELVSALTMEKFGEEDVFPFRPVGEKVRVVVDFPVGDGTVKAMALVNTVVDVVFAKGVYGPVGVEVKQVRALVALCCAAWVYRLDGTVVSARRCARVTKSVSAQYVEERCGERLVERDLCCECSGVEDLMCQMCCDAVAVAEGSGVSVGRF